MKKSLPVKAHTKASGHDQAAVFGHGVQMPYEFICCYRCSALFHPLSPVFIEMFRASATGAALIPPAAARAAPASLTSDAGMAASLSVDAGMAALPLAAGAGTAASPLSAAADLPFAVRSAFFLRRRTGLSDVTVPRILIDLGATSTMC